MTYSYRRPGHRPGLPRASRGALTLGLLGLGIVLTFLRSLLNLAILDVATDLTTAHAEVGALQGEIQALEGEIARLTTVAHLEPLAAAEGFVVAAPSAVRILALSPVSVGARPLPGAGALGRLMRQLVSIASVDEAIAAPARADAARVFELAEVPSADATLIASAHPRCDHCTKKLSGKLIASRSTGGDVR
jgi:hypothetical protein